MGIKLAHGFADILLVKKTGNLSSRMPAKEFHGPATPIPSGPDDSHPYFFLAHLLYPFT
jgi:hypothetical protein